MKNVISAIENEGKIKDKYRNHRNKEKMVKKDTHNSI